MQFRIVDTETSGPSSVPPDVACEVASVDYDSISDQFQAPRTELVHIGIPMPPDAQGVHHISNEELEGKRDISAAFKSVISPYPYPNVIMVAHNCEYEQRVLKERLDPAVQWICTLKAAYRLWPDSPNHKNQTLRYYLKLVIPPKLLGGLPHRAMPDAIVTALMLKECLKLATVEQLLQWTKEPRLLPTCPIGKKQGWAGKKWADVDPGFLQWMIDEPGMEIDLKWNAERALKNRVRAQSSEERDSYMLLVPGVINTAKKLEDLRQWFTDEKPTRDRLGIADDTDQYKTIVRLCSEQKTIIVNTPPPPLDTAPAESATA